jgi:hypothetical protein
MINNIQTIEITNINKIHISDEVLNRLIVVGNDNVEYAYPNYWRMIPGVKKLNLPNKPQFDVPSPHNTSFDFNKCTIDKLKCIANAYLIKINSTLKKQDIINLIINRMNKINSMPSYDGDEYDNFIISLDITHRGIKDIKFSSEHVMNENHKQLLINYNGTYIVPIFDITNTRFARFFRTFATRIRKRYFQLLGKACVRTELCNNQEDMVTFDSLSDIPYGELFTFIHCKKHYGISIESFNSYIKIGKLINPYNRQSFDTTLLINFRTVLLFYTFVTKKQINSTIPYQIYSRIHSSIRRYTNNKIGVVYHSQDYQFNDEMLCYIPSDSDGETIFNIIKNINRFTFDSQGYAIHKKYTNVLSYLKNAQFSIKIICFKLNTIFNKIGIFIPRFPLNSRYVYAMDRWGVDVSPTMNEGLNYLRIVKNTKLVSLDTHLQSMCNSLQLTPYVYNDNEQNEFLVITNNYSYGLKEVDICHLNHIKKIIVNIIKSMLTIINQDSAVYIEILKEAIYSSINN